MGYTRDSFTFDLPEELIASVPCAQRTGSRLLHVNRTLEKFDHLGFTALKDLLHPGDLLVLNNTRVMAARLRGHKASGGAVEVLIERIIDEHNALAHVRASKAPKTDSVLYLADGAIEATVQGRSGDLFCLRFAGEQHTLLQLLETYGELPLPPYMQRAAEADDALRYQTVYAQQQGSVAAPTAGLHFDQDFLVQLSQAGIDLGYLTLHIGAGTFQPVRVDDIREHKMHSEYFELSAALCEQVANTRARGGRVVAVGTTSVRALESASQQGELMPYNGETDIFIYPGYTFNTVDAMLTNFHLPGSTLLMLVSAFAGQELTLAAYHEAVAQRYRFYSYGDAMFIS